MLAAPVSAPALRPKGAPVPRQPNGPVLREIYEVRRAGLPVLYVTRGMLCCFFDLTMKQSALAIGVCLTTMKKIRIWSGAGAWPHADVRRNRHPQFTLESVEALRLGVIDSLQRQGDTVIHPVLARAQALSLGMAIEPFGPAPPPELLPPPAPAPGEDLDLDLSGLDLPFFEVGDGLLDGWRPLAEEGAPAASVY